MTTANILAFAGSARRDSWNRKVLQIAVEGAREAGAEVTVANLGDFPMPIYNADWHQENGVPPAMRELRKLMMAANGLLIASPEYNTSITPLLKNTIDWVSSPVKGHPEWTDGMKSSRGKVVGVLSASPGALGGLRSQSHLAPLLINLECWLAPKNFALGRAGDAFDSEGALKDERARHSVQAVIDQVIWAAARLQPA